jgi:hypothetical protein
MDVLSLARAEAGAVRDLAIGVIGTFGGTDKAKVGRGLDGPQVWLW